MTDNEYKQRKVTLDWMLEHADCYTHAVTLTMKQSRRILTDRGEMRDDLTVYSANANMRHFIRRVNCELFGNAAKRYGKSIAIVSSLEGVLTGKNLHYHCAIGNLPDRLCERAIEGSIRGAWLQTNFGNRQMHIERMQTNGWLNYMVKDIGRQNCEVLDWENKRK